MCSLSKVFEKFTVITSTLSLISAHFKISINSSKLEVVDLFLLKSCCVLVSKLVIS